MPPGAAYAGAFFRAFLGVKGGLMATFYSAATSVTSSLDDAAYARAETRVVNHGSSAFTCSPACFAGARFHGFFKASAACPTIDIFSGTTRTYISGKVKHDAWSTASTSTATVNGECASGQYVEIYHESRASSATSHTMADLLKLDTSGLGTVNLYAAYAISNTPVPLTVTN
jgi:hypothetical protein